MGRSEARLAQARSNERAARLQARLLGAGVVVFVVAGALLATPGPGGHGRPLGVSIALIGFSVATIGVIGLSDAAPALQLPVLLAAVLCAAALTGLQHDGPGFLGVFPAVSMAAFRFPVRLNAVVFAVALAAVLLAGLVIGDWPVEGALLNGFGVAGFYVLATLARRLRESNERAEGLVVELERSRAAQAEAAALGERQRLAREMHDVLAHSLSGLVLNLEGARLLSHRRGADAQVEEAIERARRLAKTGLDEARRAIATLRDDELPGPERLMGLASDFEDDTGVACGVSVRGEARELGSDARLTLYRVAQEALTNVRKHALPDRVELRLLYERSGIRLAIEDFAGPGARPLAGDGAGYGLTGMRERAELIGGALTAGPTEAGFLVELWMPG
jgi:signal transduction histidine kinase